MKPITASDNNSFDFEKGFPLPQKGDRLIAASSDIDSLLFVDPLGMTDSRGDRSPTGRWSLYADGYRHAAELILNSIQNAPTDDELLYPVIYLYRHFLELELKSLVVASSTLSPQQIVIEDLNREHDVHKLWLKCEANFQYVPLEFGPEIVGTVGSCIKEISDIDPLSQAFRYAVDRKGNQTLGRITEVDVLNLKEVMTRIRNFLVVVEETVLEEKDSRNT